MLEHSEYNCTEISEFLAFSSGAYFGHIFKKSQASHRRSTAAAHMANTGADDSARVQ